MTSDVCEEIRFGFDELFFSRTDSAGIIQSGNSVFQRVSIYGWDELVGRPHKIVRHPGTPRAVFWLLWRELKQGRPIGAYVKNRAKDGRHYWVFAVATPVGDGYLSVRLRPSSPLFQVIKQEYEQLSALEHGQHLEPEQSATLLLERYLSSDSRIMRPLWRRLWAKKSRAATPNSGDRRILHWRGWRGFEKWQRS